MNLSEIASRVPHKNTCPVENFLALSSHIPVFDVRSPCEFQQGHIPYAHSLPLFTDAERASIGTLYHTKDRDEAVSQGISFVTPKIPFFLQTIKAQCHPKKTPKVALYCWRGGERSSAMAHLLEDHGFTVYRLHQGYKAFRTFALLSFKKEYKLRILAGETGTGKTEVLKALAAEGSQTIDLENLADHHGSVFGAIAGTNQPTCEQFENRLAYELNNLSTRDIIWLEDESEKLGKVRIPKDFFIQMQKADALLLQAPERYRLARILKTYGNIPPVKLGESIKRIQKRLGGVAYKEALRLLEEKKIPELARLLLQYYDKSYAHHIKKKDYRVIIRFTHTEDVAKLIRTICLD